MNNDQSIIAPHQKPRVVLKNVICLWLRAVQNLSTMVVSHRHIRGVQDLQMEFMAWRSAR